MTGWIPFRVRAGAAPMVDWCHLGEDRFVAPFFSDTVERCMRQPFNQLFLQTTPIQTLLERHRTHPGVAPTAFIFHGSRCGSTLMAQLAAALPHVIAISEAAPIDQVLRATAVPPADVVRVEWLRALVSALGQPRAGGERHLVVKFDAWHIADLDAVQRAFPDVPAVFLYRDPAGVLGSQLRMPGLHVVPGLLDPSFIGLDLESAIRLDREEYASRMLGSVYAAAADAAETGRLTLVNYADLPGRGISLVLDWCRPADDDDRERLHSVARFDAKTPSLPYDGSASARAALGGRATEMAAQFIEPPYARLEAIRHGSHASNRRDDA